MKVYGKTASDGIQRIATETRKVGIAEYRVTDTGAELTTSGLGSCIGVALHDGTNGVAGLLHIMLPNSEVNDGNRAKFADTGIPDLVDAMEEMGAKRDRISAKIAGGSDMLDFSNNGASIGERNLEAVREIIASFAIPIDGEDIGGECGRSLTFDGRTGALEVKRANRSTVTL